MELTPREALITLNLIPGLGSMRIQALLEHFGSAELALAAPMQMLMQVPRLGEKLACAIADWRHCTQVYAELECAERAGVRIVTFMDEEYPQALRRMSDPPIVLYVLGEWRQEDATRAVSVVGTRMATPYGAVNARHFARELADSGSTIISGLARGIDTAAHWGALDADGRTIAVLGGGLSGIFPPENGQLVERIINGHGAVVSEFPMNMRPSRNTFPQRNRVVAAWSKATLVVEASHRSGSLHTAGLSAEQYGNQVFAVPGSISAPASAGCHRLIRDGAILCTSAAELIADMGWNQAPRQLNLFDQAPTEARQDDPILAAVAAGHRTLDALCSALGMPAYELTPRLMRLQIELKLIPCVGGSYMLPDKG